MKHLWMIGPVVLVLGLGSFLVLPMAMGRGSAGSVLPGMILWGIGLCFYFLPTAIALIRKKSNSVAIFALNLCLGWTLIGWVVAIVWSLMAEKPQPQPITVQSNIN